MAVIAEALGMTLPGNSTISGSDNELLRTAYRAGMQSLSLLKNKTNPSDIMTLKAIENAIKVYLSVGGSTNAIHQILDLSSQLNLDISLDTFDEISRKTPTISNVKPVGKYNLKDLDEAGGLPARIGGTEELEGRPGTEDQVAPRAPDYSRTRRAGRRVA